MELNCKKLQEYMSYFENYYGSDFRPNQGLDQITDMINKYSVPGTWIDLGGGTSTFIWLPAFKNDVRVHSVDKYIEAAYVQKQVRLMHPSGCYRHILERYGKTIDQMNQIDITFSQMDLFGDITSEVKYRNVSQFGLLGLCETKEEYLKQLEKLSAFMECESVFFGANWIFSDAYAQVRGFKNSYLETELISNYAWLNKKRLLYSEKISIANDQCYDAVLIYAFKS